MILVVQGERTSRSELVDLLGATDIDFAAGVAEARDRLETTNPVALLSSLPVEEAAPLVEDVRSGRFDRPGLPIVAVTDGDAERAAALGVDETVETPVEGPALEAAVDRAVLLGRYKSAVNEFFDACHKRANGCEVGRRSLAARRTADDRLAEIQERDDPLVFERLFQGV